MSRNSWILLGVAATAFLAFVLVEGGEQPFSNPGGSGILGLFRGGGERSGADVAGEGEGSGGIAGGEGLARRKAAAAAVTKSQRGKPAGPPDPELLKRMQAGGGGLVATGPVRAGRSGIVTQSFRAGRRNASGGDGTEIAGGAAESGGGDDLAADDDPDPGKCGEPRVNKTVIDTQAFPQMRNAFNLPALDPVIRKGWGERFKIGEAPAYVILVPGTKRASAGAFFDDRFLVLIRGECIPNRQYVKALLRQ